MKTLSKANELAREYDQARQETVEKISPVYEKARAEAEAARDALEAEAKPNTERWRKIIEAATDQRAPSRDAVWATLGLLVPVLASQKTLTDAQKTSGRILIGRLPSLTGGWSDGQKKAALDACVLACRGDVEAGVINWPTTITETLESYQARELALIADQEAVNKAETQHKEAQNRLGEAEALLHDLHAAAPDLPKVYADSQESAA